MPWISPPFLLPWGLTCPVACLYDTMHRSLLILTLLYFAVSAPPASAQEWTGALKLGGIVSTFSGDTDTTFDPRLGWAGGGALGYDFGTGLVILPELLYVVQGAHFDDVVQDANLPVRVEFSISYAQLPLLIMYRFERRGTLNPKIYAGPMVGYKLDATRQLRAQDGGPTFTEEDPSIQNTDYGVVAGAGIERNWDVQRLSVEVRGLWGLTNLRDVEPALYHRGVALMVGITF